MSGVVAEAAINTTSLANPFGLPNPVPAGQFGETAIDLTASGIFPAGVCEGFSLGLREVAGLDAASTAEVKDFVAPAARRHRQLRLDHVDKVTVPSPDPTNTSFPFVASYDADGFSLTQRRDQRQRRPQPRHLLGDRDAGPGELGADQRDV